MNTFKYDFKTLQKFSKNDIAYAERDQNIRSFYKFEPQLNNLSAVIAQRQNHPVDRQRLVEEISQQYRKFTDDPTVYDTIAQLNNDNVFTITTAHQPNLLTGPLYFIYKCLSAIKITQSFNAQSSQHKTLPILVLGGEDHDFEELNHLRLFGKTITWTDEQGGAVGRYTIDSMHPVLEDVCNILGHSENAEQLKEKINTAFQGKKSYGACMQHFVHLLLGHLGIIIVNMDCPAFKKQMIPYFKDDLINHTSYHVVNQTKIEFEAAGFTPQAHVRNINFFYLIDQQRLRIEKTATGFQTVDSSAYQWTEAELCSEIEQHPERFSPNVVLRPIYQEIILPNLAYVGGGGEIAYWLERKEQFDQLKVSFPMLIRRDSFQLISKKDYANLEDMGFKIEDLFLPDHELVEKFLSKYGRDEIDLGSEISLLDELESKIQAKTAIIDQSLVARIGAQFAKFKNDLQGVEKRLKKTEKQAHEKNLNKIRKIKDKLFPEGGLQERSDNFMTWYILFGDGFFINLLEQVDPFDTKVKTLII